MLLALSCAVPIAGEAQRQAARPAEQQASGADAASRLKEQYIWTAGDVTVMRPDRSHFSWSHTELRTERHGFRVHFRVDRLPRQSTVYVAGPRWAVVYLNGTRLGEFATNTDQPINFRVFHADATRALRVGENVLAIEVIRGRGVVSASASLATLQLAYGEVLAAKVTAGAFGDANAPALVISDGEWRSQVVGEASGWEQPGFDDSGWAKVMSLGPIESNIDFFQWSADAGMYGWPGYRGMSPFLQTESVAPAQVTHVFAGAGSFAHVESLTGGGSAPFEVRWRELSPTDEEAPSILIDFGREIAGRVVIESASARDAVVSIAYGESELEALATGIAPMPRGGNYLGTNLLDVPANGIARGPKSGFRYVRVRFLRGGPQLALRAIRAEAIVYPVKMQGSFESSDPLLNRIWDTGAYTAHLCMQDDIWDAVKRDRGRWAGDLDVEARTILTAFGDTFLLEDTLRRLAEGTPAGQPVNGIAGYTAQWITTLATLYEHSDDRAFVVSQHDALIRFLQTMDQDLDPATGVLKPGARGWGFVDWAPGLYGQTPDTSAGTTLEFLRAYEAAPTLLRAAGDESAAQKYERRAAALKEAAARAYLSGETHTAGRTWQVNALAVVTDLQPASDGAIWDGVLGHVKQDSPTDQVISPYFNAYVLEAMSRAGHPEYALNWMRAYWGGMLAEGATSFWESYDLRWPKTNFHLSLEADGTSGYFVSLAHGWSSGPVAWLTENVLGVRAAAPGYDAVEIRPNLLGLMYARGTVPTPHGMISISLDGAKGMSLDLPQGVEHARVFLPTHTGAGEGSAKVLTHSGHYEFAFQ